MSSRLATAAAARGVIPRADDGAPGDSPERAIPVSALTASLKDVIEGAFPPLWVAGEVSGFKPHRNGHWYFTLKDATASIECVVWSREQARIPAPPDEGMQVVALGAFSVWAKTGKATFAVKQMEAEGEGLWRKALEKTRAALERDGLLDPARKRPIPRFPRCVGVVTSADGAALHDIVSVISRRNPTIDIVVIPAAVQGDAAPESIVRALGRAAAWNGADVLIVGRGGGSREDLWCFNDERVARAIAASPIPVISAVGHEVDISIADLVADHRAATPSAAAELVAPVLADILRDLNVLGATMRAALVRRAADGRRDLDAVRADMTRALRRRAVSARRDVTGLRRDLTLRTRRVVERRTEQLRGVAGRLHVLSPLRTLERGYALPLAIAGGALTRVAQFAPGTRFTLKVQDGDVDATSTATRPKESA